MKPIEIIKEKFLNLKGSKKKIKFFADKGLNWDIEYIENEEKYLKCRMDDTNHVNVLVQNNFDLQIHKAIGKILNCAELFYSNNYPLIIIETKNNGGYPILANFMHQIFQIRTVNRDYASYSESFYDYTYTKNNDYLF